MIELTRRAVLVASATIPLSRMACAADTPESLIGVIEARMGGRLGVSALDTANGRTIRYRAEERFPMCSTFKTLAVSALLKRVDKGRDRLDRWIGYDKTQLVDPAPITSAHVSEGGMYLDDLAAAAVQWSDNTAANLILAQIGGPAAVTCFVRTLGDSVTRLDRIEPNANTCIPGDPRDTTSPTAMLADVQALALGNALLEASRERLVTWLANWRTRMPRIPAGLPTAWRSANKMGTGANGTTNDVAIAWPPGRAPILIAAYYTGSKADAATRDAVLAYVGSVVSTGFK